MKKGMLLSDYVVTRDPDKCINCEVCVRQCANAVHSTDPDTGKVEADSSQCVSCLRCATLCPTQAISIGKNELQVRGENNWETRTLKNIWKQAETGGVLLTAMGTDRNFKIIWDHLLIDAAQVTNPSIDPLREPMELRTCLGRKPSRLEYVRERGQYRATTVIPPQLQLRTPIMFGAMSYGAVSLNACRALAQAAQELGTFYNTGEGGLHRSLYPFAASTIVQVASGRFGVTTEYLNAGAAIEIKVGQGAKPGIGGHLPGKKVTEDVSQTRMIPVGSDAISPAPHHDIYSIEELAQLIGALKEATAHTKPVSVKIAAVHNSAAIASGIARAGADIIAIDGVRGGTGAAPLRTRDNVGIPIELALAALDARLREEGIRSRVSLVAAGSFTNSADVLKAIALGADAVYLGSAALAAMGCHQCQKCYSGKCNWGIATQDPYLVKRLNPDIATRRLVNLVKAWSHEIQELLGGLGINAIESVRGNRLRLRGFDLHAHELALLDVKQAGESL